MDNTNKKIKVFLESSLSHFKSQLHNCVEGIEIYNDALKKLFSVFVDELLYCELDCGTGVIEFIEFPVPYERCVFCHVNEFGDEIQRITDVAIYKDNVYIKVEDKEYPNMFEREYVNMSETDFDYAHLMQLLIDYIEKN